MSEQAKLCVACGSDCANVPRIKDPRGRYYHKECYQRARERSGVGAGVGARSSEDVLGAEDLLEPSRGFDLEAIMGEVAASRACPQCGAPLDGAAVICVRCGYNVQAGAPLAPPIVQRAPRERGPSLRGRIWPIVIGVISLMWAGVSLIGTVVDVDGAPGMTGGASQKIIAAVFAGWLALAAVGVLLRRQTGAVWMLWWAIVQIVLSLVFGGFAVVGLAFFGDQIAQPTGESAEYLLGVVVGSLVVGLIWPVFLVIWLRRRAIQKQIGAW